MRAKSAQSRRLGGLAIDDLRLLGLVGLGGDWDGARLHGLRQLAYEIDMQQTVLEHRALHHDMIGELEPALEAPRSDAAMEEGAVLLLGPLLTANGKGVLLHLDGEVVLTETGDCHADAILILADPLDVVGRVARSLALERGERVEQRAEPVEADGGAVKWGKIKVPHDTSSLRSDMVVRPLVPLSRAGDDASLVGLAPGKI